MSVTITYFIVLFAVSMVLTATTPLKAQNHSSNVSRVSIPDTEVHALHSEAIGDDFEIWVAKPQQGFMHSETGPPRVLYLLDANFYFGTAVEMTRLMHKLYGELPPLLVVGIAYPTENGFQQGVLRTRDFTPSEDKVMAERAASFPKMPGVQPVEPSMGGANAFAQFLENEVKPFVEARYETQEQGSILFGSSLGGLFVIHSLLSEESSFDNYIAISPALWWNEEELFNLDNSQALLDQKSANVFIGVGELEEDPAIPMLAEFKLKTNAKRMADQLSSRTASSLKVQFKEFESETHTSVVPVALTRALRKLLR